MVKFLAIMMLVAWGLSAAVPAWAAAEEDFAKGYEAAGRGDLDEALRLYSRAIASKKKLATGNLAIAYLNRGNIYADKGQYEKAINDYGAALKQDPSLGDGYLARGRVYEETGRYGKAIDEYGAAIRLNPADIEAYDSRGRAYFAMGRLDKSLADFDTAIRLDPKIAVLYDHRGLVLYKKGRVDQAFADFSTAVKLHPDYAEAFRHRGVIHHDHGDYDKAIADYDMAIRLQPDNAFAYDNRGRDKYLSGQFAAAAADFRQFLSSPVAGLYTLLWLHLAQARAGQAADAALAQAAHGVDLSKWPGPIVRFYLGDLSAEQVRAEARTTDVKAQIVHECDMSFYFGEAKLLRGTREEAKKLLGDALAHCPKGWAEHDGALADLRRFGS
jgi:tetratricopeptide (TPR) repeat protein